MTSNNNNNNQESGYLIDNTQLWGGNLYEKLGLDLVKNLSTAFYTLVYDSIDDEETYLQFGKLFENTKKEDAIQNQYEFLVQRFGGPMLFSQRKGGPMLRARHFRFSITKRSAEIWIEKMKQAMELVGITKEKMMKEREALDEFFIDVAHFLINKDDQQK